MAELHPDPDQVEQFLAQIRAQPRPARWGYGLGIAHALSMNAAREHGAECALSDCKTCAYFVQMLSLSAAWDIEYPPDPDQMRQMFGS